MIVASEGCNCVVKIVKGLGFHAKDFYFEHKNVIVLFKNRLSVLEDNPNCKREKCVFLFNICVWDLSEIKSARRGLM